MNNSRNFQKLKLSPFALDAELFFNANYFLQAAEQLRSSPAVSSSDEQEEEMETHQPFSQPLPQQLQQQTFDQSYVMPMQQQPVFQQSLRHQQQQINHSYELQQYQLQQQQYQLQQQRQQQLLQLRMQQRQQQQHHLMHHQYQQEEEEQQRQVKPEVTITRIIQRSANSTHSDLITKATHNHNAMLSNVNVGQNYKSHNYAGPMVSIQQNTNLLAEEYEKLVDSFNQVHEKEKESQQFKLPSSKSPIMEALVYCSINKYGIELKELNTTTNRILFYVSDFNVYYKQSCSICSKQSPSEDIRARMKALQRWFVTFPAWRELEYPFELLVKPSHYNKMHEIISKMVRFYENVDIDVDSLTG